MRLARLARASSYTDAKLGSSTSKMATCSCSRTQGGNAQGRIEPGSRHYDCGARIGTRVFHAPQQLAVKAADVQTDRGGPPLGLGVKLLVSALGVDVDEVDLACKLDVGY